MSDGRRPISSHSAGSAAKALSVKDCKMSSRDASTLSAFLADDSVSAGVRVLKEMTMKTTLSANNATDIQPYFLLLFIRDDKARP